MKTNKQFKEWLIENYAEYEPEKGDKNIWVLYAGDNMFISWSELPFSMQWGIYLEFFDSVEIRIKVDPRYFVYHFFCYSITGKELSYKSFDTRQEAQEAAIEKAFEILENL